MFPEPDPGDEAKGAQQDVVRVGQENEFHVGFGHGEDLGELGTDMGQFDAHGLQEEEQYGVSFQVQRSHEFPSYFV
jgi:hypothetical protein